MTMTREQAIRTYVENLSKDELVELLQHMNAYDSCFEDEIYYDMDEFDEFMSNYSPMEIAQMIYFGGDFNPNDDYFRFNAYGNLESANWRDVEAEAEDLADDIVYHLVNSYSGDTPWSDLDTLVDADDDALFDDDFEEIDEEDEDFTTDKELANKLFSQGTTETTTGNWIFTLDDLDGRTPEQALAILYAQGYQEYILDAECTDDTLDLIFALDVCPNAEQEEEED